MKTQNIRLADVFAIGPLMVWGGMKLREDNPLLGPALAALGVATVWYNGRNYLRVRSGDRIEGGSAAGRSASSLDPRQLRMGINEEMEHTTSPDIAREIAMDHLVEDPHYYTKLKKAGL